MSNDTFRDGKHKTDNCQPERRCANRSRPTTLANTFRISSQLRMIQTICQASGKRLS